MTTIAPAKPEDLLALQKRNDDRIAKVGGNNAALAFAKDVKNSLLFQYDWADLLSAAPLSISLIGSCYVAATCPAASGLSLKECMPPGGFKKIRHPELRACLLEVTDAGRFAFIEAEKKMDLIASQSTFLGRCLSEISGLFGYLPAPDAAASLNNKIKLLKEGSDNCLKYSQDIENKFRDWLELVCEVHQVTVAKEEQSSATEQDNAQKLVGLDLESDLTSKSLANAAQAAKDMKQNMDKAKDMFEKAADAIPGPWEQVGMQLVSSLSQAATTTVSQGLPVLLGTMVGGPMGPMAGARASAGAAAPHGATNGAKVAKGAKGSKSSSGEKVVSSQLSVVAVDPSDPAYAVANSIDVVVTTFAALLGVGTPNGFTWDNFKPPSTGDNASRQGFTFVAGTLNHALSSTQWTSGEASKELKDAILKLIEVTKAIDAENKKDKSLTGTKLAADSHTVKAWQAATVDGQAKIAKLKTAAAALPGSAPGAAPFIGVKPTAASDNSTDQTALTGALRSAQEKLSVTEAAYTSSQQNYQKAVEHRSKIEAELTRIQSSLKTLQANQMSLAEIKKVLIQCIGAIVQLKQQITNLVRFFGALSAMIEHVVKNQVRDFLDQADVAKTCMIGNISLGDMTRQSLYTTTLMVQAYFSLFTNIAQMYKKMSIEHVMPGVRLCDELSQVMASGSGSMEKKMKELQTFTDRAQQAVKDEVAKAQDTISKSLEDRVTAVQADTKLLPAPHPDVRRAIEAGKSSVSDAVTSSIEMTENPVVVADTSVDPNDI